MRTLVCFALVALVACKPSKNEALGKVLLAWDGAKCTAFLTERGWAVTDAATTDADGSVKCEGERHGDRVIMNLNHAESNSKARMAEELFEEKVSFEVKAFGTVYVQFRQSSRRHAEALRDACVPGGDFTLAGMRACLIKEGWTPDDECDGDDESGACGGEKKQVYGRMTARVSFDQLSDSPEESKRYDSGMAFWSKKPHSIDVTTHDYDATHAWMLELEKALTAQRAP